jgi:hypothetical protein
MPAGDWPIGTCSATLLTTLSVPQNCGTSKIEGMEKHLGQRAQKATDQVPSDFRSLWRLAPKPAELIAIKGHTKEAVSDGVAGRSLITAAGVCGVIAIVEIWSANPGAG